MLIKLANEIDLPHIVAIYNESIPCRQATADTELVSIESRQEWFRNHKDRRPLWIAEKDNEIIGWASLQDFYGRPAYQKTVEFSIYIKLAYRRQGVAQKLCPMQLMNVLTLIYQHYSVLFLRIINLAYSWLKNMALNNGDICQKLRG